MTISITRVSFGLGVLAFCALPQLAHSQLTVNSGFDLFQTESGTNFMGVDFMGVPIGSHNFGGAVGVKPTKLTDTIIQRQGADTVAAAGDTGTVQVQMVALQLESTAPTTFGGLLPLNDYFIALQSIHGGPASTGTMNITFNSPAGGTFTSSLDIFFDVRAGSLGGAIVDSSSLLLSSGSANWGRVPPAGAVTISGANLDLNGVDNTTDFWTAPITENPPGGGGSEILEGAVPEPSAFAAFVVAGCLGLLRRRKTKAS